MRTVFTLARRAVLFEVALYRSLARWIFRRPAVPAGGVPFAYVGVIAALLWVFIVVSAIELVVLHLALPWERVRLVADILSLWGLVWMLGMLASLRVHPHVVADSGLRVRHGTGTEFVVPWDAVAGVGVRERGLEKSKKVQVARDGANVVLSVVVAGRTNVDVRLNRPLVVRLREGDQAVTELRLFADDPRGLAALARERIPAETAREEPGRAAGRPRR